MLFYLLVKYFRNFTFSILHKKIKLHFSSGAIEKKKHEFNVLNFRLMAAYKNAQKSKAVSSYTEAWGVYRIDPVSDENIL